jgi:tight adherence protein B
MTLPGALCRAVVVGAVAVAVIAPAAWAQDDAGVGLVAAEVTAVDATTATVELAVIGAGPEADLSDLALSERGEPVDVARVTTTEEENRSTEVVFVVDTNARAAEGDVLGRVKSQLAAEVEGLPAATQVAIVAAGDTALIETRLTSDRARVAQAINDLSLSGGSLLYDGIRRAGIVLGDTPGVVRSVVVLSSGPDTGSEATLDEAQVALVQKGAQLVSVLFDGGDLQLARSVSRTAGVELSAASVDDVAPTLAEAVTIARDRLLVSFRSETEIGTRVNVTLEIGGLSTTFSYPAGVYTGSVLQLAPQPEEEGTAGLGVLTSSVGLYVSLVLAFVGISLGVWSLGSIMSSGDSSLEGMLSRYTEGGTEAADGDVAELVVQSALLQRAVSFSESFAAKRGFLIRVEELLERANLPIRPGEAMFILAAITVLSSGLGLAATGSFIAALLFGTFATALSFFIVRFKARRRFKTFESQLPDTLQLLAGTLRAGYSLPQGFEVVSREIADPMGHELRRAMSEARLGRDLEDCLGGVAERLSSGDFAWAVMAIGIQREVGGNLNELLTSVADTMIARERLKREISALTAEGRVSAAVLSFLPPGLGLVMWVMNPGYVGLLFSEFIGNVLLAMGLVSGFIGLAWMKKVITVDV